MKTSLSQVNKKLLNLYLLIEENEGEFPEDLEEYYIKTQEEFSEALEDYTVVWETYDEEINKTIELSKKLKERATNLEKRKERIGEFIQESIKRFGVASKSPKGYNKWSAAIPGGEVIVNPSEYVKIEGEEIYDSFEYIKYGAALKDLSSAEMVKLKKLLEKAKLPFEESKAPVKALIKKDLEDKKEIKGASLDANYKLIKKVKAAKL